MSIVDFLPPAPKKELKAYQSEEIITYPKLDRKTLSRRKPRSIGFMVIKSADIGPELVYHESVPFPKREVENKAILLGCYLAMVFNHSIEDNQKMGLIIDLPYQDLPHHHLLVFGFYARDNQVQDARAIQFGIPVFIAIILEKKSIEFESLLYSRLELEQSFRWLFVRNTVEEMVLINENASLFVSQVKSMIHSAIQTGETVIQEQALDLLTTDSSIKFLALFNAVTFQLKHVIKQSERVDFKELLSYALQLKMDLIFVPYKEKKFGMIKLGDYLVIGIWSGEVETLQFMDIIRLLNKGFPLIDLYFSQ